MVERFQQKKFKTTMSLVACVDRSRLTAENWASKREEKKYKIMSKCGSNFVFFTPHINFLPMTMKGWHNNIENALRRKKIAYFPEYVDVRNDFVFFCIDRLCAIHWFTAVCSICIENSLPHTNMPINFNGEKETKTKRNMDSMSWINKKSRNFLGRSVMWPA